jgi:hypothetical protein
MAVTAAVAAEHASLCMDEVVEEVLALLPLKHLLLLLSVPAAA